MGIGKVGIWDSVHWDRLGDSEALAELEKLGCSTLWLGSSSADLRHVEQALAASTTLTVASGIMNVWEAPPAPALARL